MQKVKLSQRGASILEVVIMSGVMVAMMTGFMTLIGHETKNITYLEDKLSRVALESELRMQMGGTDFCQDLLGGIVMPQKDKSMDVTQTLGQSLHAKALDQVFQKRNAKTVYDQLELKKVLLEDSSLIAPSSSGTISIDFYPERIRKGGGPESLLPVKIKTTVSVDAGYKLLSCSGEENQGKSCVAGDLLKKYKFPSAGNQIYCTKTWSGGQNQEWHYGRQKLSTPFIGAYVQISGKEMELTSDLSKKVPSQQIISVMADFKMYEDSSVGHPQMAKHSEGHHDFSFSMQCSEGEWFPTSYFNNPSSSVYGPTVMLSFLTKASSTYLGSVGPCE